MDDFWAAAPPKSNKSQHVVNTMKRIALELGVPLAADKTIGPTTRWTFLGILIDTQTQTLSLPPEKSTEIYDLSLQWAHKSSCNKQELQSLIGSLMFASKCVPSSRLFIQRMLDLLHGISKQQATIELDPEFHLDVQWWLEFLPKGNGTATFLENDWTSSEILHLYTDASGSRGMGAFFNGSWFQSRWPKWISNQRPCIEFLQMLPVLLAILVWGQNFRNKRILMHCDNLGAVQAWKKLGSSNRGVLAIMRRMVSAAELNNMQLKLVHIQAGSICGPAFNTIPGSMDRTKTGTLQEANIDCVVQQLQHHHIAQSTRATYDAGSRRFLPFCLSNNYLPLPSSENTIRRFIAALFTDNISLSTVRVYLAGIANTHIEHSMPNPTTSEAIPRVLNGYKRMTCRKDDQRLPVTLSLMRHLKDKLAPTDFSDQDKTMYWSAFTISFWGSPHRRVYQPVTKILHSPPNAIPIRRPAQQRPRPHPSSTVETDQFSHGYSIHLPATSRCVCPVRAAAKYLHYREARGKESAPLFQLASGQFLTRQSIDATLKMCLRDVPNSHRYSSHSLRIGTATTAAQNGASPWSIQQIGRWKSDCFSFYVRSEVPVIGLQPY